MRSVRWFLSPVVLLSLVLSPAIAPAQLFENLRALGQRLDSGDPSVLPANGDDGPKGIDSGDLDGDGRADLAVSNLDGTITVYFAREGGEFDGPLHLPTGASTLRELEAADLDGDGRLDLAAMAPYDGIVAVLRNLGGRTFALRTLPAWGGARNLETGDFDGDGRLDLAVAGPGVGLRQYRGTSDGWLEPVAELTDLESSEGRFPRPVYSLRRWRRPGAGRDDLVVTHARSHVLWVLSAGATGRLEVRAMASTADPRLTPPEGDACSRGDCDVHGVYSLDVARIGPGDAGGAPDLITAHRNLGTVQVRRGITTAEGISFEDSPYQTITIPGGPRAVRSADLDGDGWNDLVVVVRNLDRVLTYRNSGGTFVPASELPVGTSPREVTLGDFGGDGALDLAVINRGSADMSVLEGRPGEVSFSVADQLYATDGEVVDLEVLDLDGDGRADVVQLHRAASDVSVRLAGADGTLAAPDFYPVGPLPNELRIRDVTGDGHLDIVTVNLGRQDIEDGSLSIRPGDGSGTFGAENRLRLPPEAQGGRLFALEAADFNGDGHTDLAAGFLDCRLGFFRGHPDGSFAFTGVREFVYEGRAMATGDFDQDGDIDLAAASFQGNLVVLENRGDVLDWSGYGRQDYPPPGPGVFGATDLAASDLNGDGDPELIVGTDAGAFVYAGREGASFEPAAGGDAGGVAAAVSSLALADFDGDGDLDMAVACRILSCVWILARTAGGEYAVALSVDVPSADRIAAGDIDGDGRADLVGTGSVLWTALSSRRARPSAPPEVVDSRPRADSLVINEILASNTELPVAMDLEQGRTPDWIELYNGTPEPLSLSRWMLRLEVGATRENVFSLPDRVLPSGAHLLLIASEETKSPIHTGFNLPRSGGTLSLVSPDERPVDSVAYPPQRSNVSYARYRDGIGSFVFNLYPSPGSGNTDNGTIQPEAALQYAVPASLALWEPRVLPRPNEPIRFYAVATDDVGVVSASMVYKRLDVPDDRARRIVLYDDGLHEDGELQDGLFAGVLQPGLPAGGEIRFYIEVVDLSDNTLRLPEDARLSDGNAAYSLSVGHELPGIEISELVASNQSGLQDEGGSHADWVELRNCSDRPVRLDGVFLGERFPANEEWFEFPSGMELAPGGHVVVFCDGNEDEGPLHAPFHLDAGGEELLLVATAPHGGRFVADRVEYGSQLPDVAWARQTCDGGWGPAQPTPGTANRSSSAARGDVDQNGRLDITDPIAILGYLYQGSEIDCTAAADADSSGDLNVTDPIYILRYLFLAGPSPAGEVACD